MQGLFKSFFLAIFSEDKAHVLVLLQSLHDAGLYVVVHWRSNGLVHPVPATLLIDHALVEGFLFIHAITTTLPVRRIAHLDQTAVVEGAADILARIHSHISHAKCLGGRVGSPLSTVLEAIGVQGLRMLT